MFCETYIQNYCCLYTVVFLSLFIRAMKLKHCLNLEILQQPDDTTCGPTSLHAVYTYHKHNLPLQDVIDSVNALDEGGTFGVMLGLDALKRGFDATLYSFNMKLFDPSWSDLSPEELFNKLEQQKKYKKGKRFDIATKAYQEFLKLGGKVVLNEVLTPKMLSSFFAKDLPVLTGLSATYLYQTKREFTGKNNQSVYDDMKGEPMGHFVVLCGTDHTKVFVADPYEENPISETNYYEVDIYRLINAIMLGIITYDAVLLIVSPKKKA